MGSFELGNLIKTLVTILQIILKSLLIWVEILRNSRFGSCLFLQEYIRLNKCYILMFGRHVDND